MKTHTEITDEISKLAVPYRRQLLLNAPARCRYDEYRWNTLGVIVALSAARHLEVLSAVPDWRASLAILEPDPVKKSEMELE